MLVYVYVINDVQEDIVIQQLIKDNDDDTIPG